MKYRLKKWYPALPATYCEGEVFAFPKGIHVCSNDHTITLSEASAKEFWEFVQKDYEILKYKSDWSGKIYNGGCVDDSGFKIYSIKRLSDGEVFTVGDKYKNLSGTFTIKGFKITDDFVFVKAKEYGGCGLNNIQPLKEPLFTTEDGVDIYEGDKTFMVDKDRYEIVWKYDQTPKKIKIGGNALFFSTKEKAQEYIDLNKPRYSKQDIERALKHSWYYRYGEEKELILNEHNFYKSLNEKV